MVEYSEIDPFVDLKPGDQIAIKGLFKDLDKSLRVLYPIFSSEGFYYHHGIFIGNNTVVHFQGESAEAARVCKTSLWLFVQGAADKRVYRIDHKDKEFLVDDICSRAEEVMKLESKGDKKWPAFSILWNNCETLATWIKTGKPLSHQVSEAMKRGGVAIAAAGLAIVGSVAGSIAVSGK